MLIKTLKKSSKLISDKKLLSILTRIYEYGYYDWYILPLENKISFVGKSVLEIGSGMCWHAPFYLELGAMHLSLAEYYEDELLTDIVELIGKPRILKSNLQSFSDSDQGIINIPIRNTIYREQYCYITAIPFGITKETHELYEDEQPLNKSGALHDTIREIGNGRYSIWGPTLYFSTSNNTDVVSNQKQYTLRKKKCTTYLEI